MFGMLRLAMTLLICILVVGFYMGWFSFSRSPSDPQSDKVNINVSVDENKVRSDLQKAEQNLSQADSGGKPAPRRRRRPAFGPAAGDTPAEFRADFPTAVRPTRGTAQRSARGPAVVRAVFRSPANPAGRPRSARGSAGGSRVTISSRARGAAAEGQGSSPPLEAMPRRLQPGKTVPNGARSGFYNLMTRAVGGRRWTENTSGGGFR